MLISEAYRRLNADLHTRPEYGCGGVRHAGLLRSIVMDRQITSVLDYGCGKGTLRPILGAIVREYDPAIPGKDSPPDPADMVVCTDVLEHVEPECLEDVLDDIRRCSLKMAFMTIHTGPAKKILADGRNAHLTQEPYTWWLPRIWGRFHVLKFINGDNGFLVICA